MKDQVNFLVIGTNYKIVEKLIEPYCKRNFRSEKMINVAIGSKDVVINKEKLSHVLTGVTEESIEGSTKIIHPVVLFVFERSNVDDYRKIQRVIEWVKHLKLYRTTDCDIQYRLIGIKGKENFITNEKAMQLSKYFKMQYIDLDLSNQEILRNLMYDLLKNRDLSIPSGIKQGVSFGLNNLAKSLIE